MPNKNKQKGKSNERFVANMLSEHIGLHFQRVPNSGAFTGGANVSRLVYLSATQVVASRGDIIPPEGYTDCIFEVKSRKEFSFNLLFEDSCKELDSWLEQALVDYNAAFPTKNNIKLFVVFKINQRGCFVASIGQDLKIPIHSSFLTYNYVKENKKFIVERFDEKFIKEVIKKNVIQ